MSDMALEIRHLKLIESIAEHGTMTRASELLYLSQSALSHQLAELETSVGVSLFRRLPRRMVLTGPGERLLRSARVVLKELREAERELSASSKNGEGTLRITTECYTCYHWLPASLKPFESRYPHVQIQIVADATRRPFEALLADEVDVAIVAGPVASRRFNSQLLFHDEMVVVTHPEHPLAARPYVQANDFADQHLLTYSVPEEELTVWTDVLKPAGVRPAKMSRVELTEAMIEMVRANLGIAVLARWAVTPWLSRGSLKAIRLTKAGKFRDWSAVTRRVKHKPEYLDAFIDQLISDGAPR
jgi:LysR family transcriptional regulator, regulator for metE and metH